MWTAKEYCLIKMLAKQKGLCLAPKSQKCWSQADLSRQGIPKLRGATAEKALFQHAIPLTAFRDGTLKK